MRLWSDEIEAMREEARSVVAQGNAFMQGAAPVAGMSRDEQVLAARKGIDANTYPVRSPVHEGSFCSGTGRV